MPMPTTRCRTSRICGIARQEQALLTEKLGSIEPFIGSDVRLRTELMGHNPPAPGERGTLRSLLQEYATVILGTARERDRHNREPPPDDRAATRWGRYARPAVPWGAVTALQPPVSEEVQADLNSLLEGLFACPSPSKASVDGALARQPVHDCGLSFANAQEHIEHAAKAVEDAGVRLDDALQHKFEIFRNTAVRDRLRQGESEPEIARLLKQDDMPGLKSYLVQAVLDDASLVEKINRYLKRVAVRRVRMAEFRPGQTTIEADQIEDRCRRVQGFLGGAARRHGAGWRHASCLAVGVAHVRRHHQYSITNISTATDAGGHPQVVPG